jgi:NAD(P)-dependent dehydrogenase (short-subunit alcohol dehydrogenase family)
MDTLNVPFYIEEVELSARRERLVGRVVVVTGASGGVGQGAVLRFAEAGAVVVAASRDLGRARKVAEEPIARGHRVIPEQADPTNEAELSRLIERTVNEHGRIDVIVNNAATIQIHDFLETPVDEWRRVMSANTDSVFLGTTLAARRMLHQTPDPLTACRGKIINIGSPATEFFPLNQVAYGASKAAVNHFSKTASLGMADHAIAVSVVYPGNVWEGMQSQLNTTLGANEGVNVAIPARRKLESWPNARWQRPADTADILLFVAAYQGMGLNGKLVVAHPHVHEL